MGRIRNIFKLPKYSFEEVCILREVVVSIIGLAQDTHPKEFSAFLNGVIQGRSLYLTGLSYQPYIAGEYFALIRADLPLIHNTYGTVHSHPGYSCRPSDADLHFFSKTGIVNLIICRPYTEKSIRAYDKNGREIAFRIIEKFIKK